MSEDRRRYFRIDDEVSMKYRCLTESEFSQLLKERQTGFPDKIALSSAFSSTSHQMKHLVETIRHRDADLSVCLEHINEKLDVLIRLLVANEHGLPDHPSHSVSLSASGICFHAADKLPEGSILEIKLMMFPSFISILTYGTIVHCQRDDNGDPEYPYKVSADFSHIQEEDRELMVKHVLQKQAQILREANQSLPDPE